MRTSKTYSISSGQKIKAQLLQWSQAFEEVVWLDSNAYPEKYSSYDAVLAVAAFTALKTDVENAFDKLQEYQETTADWIFGYLSYDLKNDTETLVSRNHDGLKFADLYFFQPQKVFLLKGEELELQYLRVVDDEMDGDMREILQLQPAPTATGQSSGPGNGVQGSEEASKEGHRQISPRISQEQYLQKVQQMLRYIQQGDIYEANFCQEFYAEKVELDPYAAYKTLNSISNPPFAAFLRLYDLYLLSASPERYLKKQGQKLVSQPIKGTARRAATEEEDALLIDALEKDPKERAENVMIVDLVRNDLSRTAKKGTVEVEELCGIYSFQQVHQMISTISSELEEGLPPVEALRSSFPMGSMTGAPKISAMKIIEQLEESKRGLYSGALGYFTPTGDFDFNVVIRSILYNRAEQYVSFSVGGAITAASVPEKEYEECLLKASAMREVLEALLH